MKKIVAMILALVMVLGLVACGGKADSNVLKIGLCQRMTGSMVMSGNYSQKGVQLAIDQINADGGLKVGDKTYTLELVIEDNEGKTDITINAVNKLISEGVVGIVGTNSSSTSMAGGPIATDAKVPMISTTGTNPDVTKVGGEYMFRSCWIDPYQGCLAAKLAFETLGKRRAAVLYNNADDYSTGEIMYML